MTEQIEAKTENDIAVITTTETSNSKRRLTEIEADFSVNRYESPSRGAKVVCFEEINKSTYCYGARLAAFCTSIERLPL